VKSIPQDELREKFQSGKKVANEWGRESGCLPISNIAFL
jgi:hypothetical protein